MKKHLLIAGLVLLSACHSVGYDDLNPQIQPNSNLLPVLEVRPDYTSIRAVYNEKQDERIADALNIFNKEVRENIMEPTGEKMGYITLRLGYGKTERNSFYERINRLGYIPALFGVPFDNAEQTLEIEVLVQNTHKDIIKRYVENVSDTEYAALYWGYDKDDVKRKVAAENMKNAMANIRRQINNDAPEIRARLK